MNYYRTPEGIIFNENNIIIEPDDNNPLWVEYVSFLTNGGTIIDVDYEITQQQPEVPNEVALWKLRFILSQMSLEQSVTDAINQLPEPQKTAATYIWNYGNAIDRYSSTVMFIQSHLQMSNSEVDSIFIQASEIVI